VLLLSDDLAQVFEGGIAKVLLPEPLRLPTITVASTLVVIGQALEQVLEVLTLHAVGDLIWRRREPAPIRIVRHAHVKSSSRSRPFSTNSSLVSSVIRRISSRHVHGS